VRVRKRKHDEWKERKERKEKILNSESSEEVYDKRVCCERLLTRE